MMIHESIARPFSREKRMPGKNSLGALHVKLQSQWTEKKRQTFEASLKMAYLLSMAVEKTFTE